MSGTKQEIMAQLHAKYQNRKCHTMADLVAGTVSNDADGTLDGKAQAKELMESKFFAAARKHSKSQDTTADLVELADFVIKAPAPEAIGRGIVKVVEMNKATRKVRIVDPAIAADTARGRADAGRGTLSRYITLAPEKEFESHSSWDDKFLEDAEWDVATEEVEGISTALKLRESQKILDFISEVPAAELAGNGLYQAQNAGTFQWADIVKMRNQMVKAHVRPDTLIIHDDQLTDLLTVDDKFLDSTLLGEFMNLDSGLFGRTILGISVYVTSQINPGTAVMLDSRYAIIYGIRRDSLLKPYEEVQDGNTKYGVKISTRYDLKVGLGTYLLRCENA